MLEILNWSFWSWARSSSWEASHRGHPIEAAVLVPRSRQLRGGEREGCGERPVRGHVEDPAVSAVGWRHPSRYAENGQEGPSESLDRVNHRCKFDLPFFPTTSPT